MLLMYIFLLKDPSIIPPVEFDWTGSGLTNPLDCSASTLMDLTFLSSVGNSTNQASNDNSKFSSFVF